MLQTTRPLSFRLFAGCIFFYLAIMCAANAKADLVYEFYSANRFTGGGDILAILELSALPADATNVISITFTDAWNDSWPIGIGDDRLFTPESDQTTSGLPLIDIDGFLTTSGDFTRLRSRYPGRTGVEDPELRLDFLSSPPPWLSATSSMILYISNSSGEYSQFKGDEGVWRAVPEPSAFLFGGLVCGVLGLGGLAAKRRRAQQA